MGVPGPAEPGFVGRQRELAELAAALERAGAGKPGFAAVVGPAGIGKTGLVRKSTGPGAPADLVVLSGGCVFIPGIDVQSPYGPFMEALRRIPEVAGDAVAARAHRWVRPQRRASAYPVEERRAEFLGILGALAEDRTVALVLEDLHWADRSSLGLLVFLARNLTTERVLVIATARTTDGLQDESRVAVLEHLRRLPDCRWLELPGLAATEIASIARDSGATGAQVTAIVQLADGNPLTATELAERCSRGDGIGVPASTRAAVRERLREITPAARRVVHAAAVVGVEVPRHLLCALVCGPDEPPGPQFETDLPGELLTVDGQVCRFRHELDRQAVYEQVPPAERARWHERVARCLEVVAGSGPEVPAELRAEIAAHWALTSDTASAAAAALRAGMAARAVSAFPEALAHLESGRQLWRSLPGDPPGWAGCWSDVAMAAAACARWTGELARGLSMLEDAVGAATGPDRALLWDRIGRFRREIGDGRGAVDAYERVLSVPPEDLDPTTWANVRAGYAALLMTSFRLGEADWQCEAALAAAGPDPSPARAYALNTLGVVRVLTGDPDRGLALLEESREIAITAGSQEDFWRYVGNVTFVLQNLGRTGEAVDIALTELGRARKAGVHRSAAVLPTLLNAVSGMVLLGRWTDALTLAREALEDAPTPGQAASLHIAAAEIHTVRGNRPAAEAALAAARAGAANAREPELVGHIWRIEAELMAWNGHLDRARHAVDEGLKAVPDSDPDSQLQLARIGLRVEADAAISRSTGRPGRVTELDVVAKAAAPGLAELAGFRLDPGATLVLACRAESARSRRRDTPEIWQRIAAGWQEVGHPYPVAYALFREAEAWLRAGNRRAALGPLRAAAGHATRLGAAPLRDAVALLARKRRLPLTDPEPDPDQQHQPAPTRAVTKFGLTRREVDVLALLVAGLPNKAIAATLGIEERTATTHLTRIYEKLDVDGRSAATEATHRFRLLAPEDG